MTSRPPPFLRAATRAVVRLAAMLVPVSTRPRFVGEWDAELEREFRNGGGSEVLRAAFGAFADARMLGRLERSRTGRWTVGERLGGWGRDAKIALRGLARAPAYTTVSVLTLAVGIGGSATIYTLIDRVVLAPLPYPDPEQLVRLENQVPGVGPDTRWQLSTAQWVHLTGLSETLTEVGLYGTSGANVLTSSGPQRARLAGVTASMISLLGAHASLGRAIGPDDDQPGSSPVAMLSYAFWTRTTGSDPTVVGTTIQLNDEPVEVVGVLAPEVELPGQSAAGGADVWLPLRIDPDGSFGNNHVYPGIARLSEGVTTEAAEVEIAQLTARLPEAFSNAYSAEFLERYGFRTVVTPLKAHVLGDLARNLWILFGGVGLVLLISFANVTNLLLVRIEGKQGELAIRTALGADRGALTRHLIAEGMTLSLIGGSLALVVGFWAIPAVIELAPTALPRVHGIGVGAGTVRFALGLSMILGAAFALYPIIGHSGAAPHIALADAGRGGVISRARNRVRSGLVVAQVALALMLVVSAGLLFQSLEQLHATDVGFDPGGVLAVDLHLSPVRYPDDVATWGVYREITTRIAALPGVASVGMGEEIPVEGAYGCTVQGFEDESTYDRLTEAGLTTCAGQQRVTPGYPETLGLSVLEGRTLSAEDVDDAARGAVVVSRAFADRFWPGESALGKGVSPGRTRPPFHHVVGVVSDVPRASDDGRPPLSQEAIAIYYPVVDHAEVTGNWYWWAGSMTLLARVSTGEATSLTPTIRRTIAEIDPEIPVANARELEAVVDRAIAHHAFVALLVSIAAALALLLAAIGLYGTISYVVAKRTREIGMRLAIGAHRREVERMVVATTLRWVLAGLAIGVPFAYVGSSVLRGLLVGVEPTEPASYLWASIALLVVATMASWLPAHRAASIDPVLALRSD